MKPITKQLSKKAAFTIVELLTVMTIIVVLISLLVPSLNLVKRYSKEVKQRTQFHSIDAALELFSSDWDGYPPSEAEDKASPAQDYCGAMKLSEAMVGQDLMGFHPNSRFRSDGEDGVGNDLYATSTFTPDGNNLRIRKTYLQIERITPCRLKYLYGAGNTEPFDEDLFVLCDVYNTMQNLSTGKKIGMPILYYKADTTGFKHDPTGSFPVVGDNKDYIYNYTDNDELVQLGPGVHPLSDPNTFYNVTEDKRIDITNVNRPYRPDSYILISAGFDGKYGTDDDITNF